MDSARFLLAIVLMIAVIVVTNLLFPPARPPQRDPEAGPPAGPPAETAAAPRPREAAPVPGEAAPPPRPSGLAADTIRVKSRLYEYGLSTRGGSLVSAALRLYPSYTREGPVQLVPETAPALVAYRLRLGDRVLDLSQLAFHAEPGRGMTLESPGSPRSVRLLYDDPQTDLGVTLTYTFQPEDYRIQVRGRVDGAGDTAPVLLIDMGPRLASNEADTLEDIRGLAYTVNSTKEGLRSVRLASVKTERIEEGPLAWFALRNKYFLAAVMAPEGGSSFGGVIARKAQGESTVDLTATLPLGSSREFAFDLYLGPQEQDRLTAMGQSLKDVKVYGWRLFRPILRPLAHFISWTLVGLHSMLGIGYGWVLILFGILVRIVLWPLNSKAMRSQLKTMEVQPRVKEIQAKYKQDPEKMQREMMRLYKEEGFNPMGGCLPLLIPFPVLITLFFVFRDTIEFRGVEFLWLPDLARADPYYILPLVLGASMFFMQWLSTRSAPAQNQQMKLMLWIMPGMMTVLFLNFASGLNLYYAVSNIASVPQQLLLGRERRRHQAAQAAKTTGG